MNCQLLLFGYSENGCVFNNLRPPAPPVLAIEELEPALWGERAG